jgi:5'-methylthioadenosine phosphorylase
MIVKTVHANAAHARALVKATAPKALQPPGASCPHGCQRALEFALITGPEARDPRMIQMLEVVAGRVLRA